MKFDSPETFRNPRRGQTAGLQWPGWFLLFAGWMMVAPLIGHSQTKPVPAAPQPDQELSKNWVKVEPTGANASFEMPFKPRYVERIFSPIPDEPPIKVRLHIASAGEGALTCVFSYHDLYEKPDTKTKINATLDGAVNGSVVNVLGQLVGPEEIGLKSNPVPVTTGIYPGRQYVCRFIQKGKIYIITAKIFLVEKRLYQLNCIMPEDGHVAELALQFINSFELIEPVNDLPPRPRPRD